MSRNQMVVEDVFDLEEPSKAWEQSESHVSDGLPITAPQPSERIAHKESKRVMKLRILVLVTLLLSMVIVSVTVYTYLNAAEMAEFEAQFHSNALKVLGSVGKTMDDTLGAADAFGVKLVSYAEYSNSTWPYVTMPHFALHAQKVLQLSKAFHISIKPAVPGEEREMWENYTFANDEWIQDALDLQETLPDWRAPIVREFDVNGIVGLSLEDVRTAPIEGRQEFLPVWQQTPMMTGESNPIPYNRDAFAIPGNEQQHALAVDTKRVTLGEKFWHIIRNESDAREVYLQGLSEAWTKNFIPEDEPSFEPTFAINIPIVPSLDRVQIDVSDDSVPVVAVMTFSYYYRSFLRGILPSSSQGVLVVTENVCDGGQAFTYRLDGDQATYIGPRDFHNPKYDRLERTALLSDLLGGKQKKTGSHYTGLPLAADFCPKTIRIFPDESMEAEYRTGRPILFTSLAAVIFAFTSSIFLVYDYLVARRQKVVVGRAQASGAIVSSLFPDKVRDQLYEEQKKKPATDNGFRKTATERKLEPEKSRPIAEVYPETTIFFLDIKGFTKWSSSRAPVEVFDLLEGLYGSFDRVAARRKVFKVETIGDSYMAVTGIPEAQPDHAVIMSKFARDCLMEFSLVTHRLSETLGEDTAELRARIGLHSGSVTGGVLRGEKGRFQLFGDTVNTASRMESTGLPGLIQCSPATAEALIAHGKASWLTPREGSLEVKGKGQMKTFFVDPGRATRTESIGTKTISDDGVSDDSPAPLPEPPRNESSSTNSSESCRASEPKTMPPADFEKRLNERLAQNLAGNRFL